MENKLIGIEKKIYKYLEFLFENRNQSFTNNQLFDFRVQICQKFVNNLVKRNIIIRTKKISQVKNTNTFEYRLGDGIINKDKLIDFSTSCYKQTNSEKAEYCKNRKQKLISMKTNVFLKDESGNEIFRDLTNITFVELIKNVRVGEEITIDNINYQITGKETDLDKNCINLFSHSNE